MSDGFCMICGKWGNDLNVTKMKGTKMVKLKIIEQIERTVNLDLVQNRDGSVSVVAVDEDGIPIGGGYILAIESSGHIFRNWEVNPDLGFKQDDKGQIKLAING